MVKEGITLRPISSYHHGDPMQVTPLLIVEDDPDLAELFTRAFIRGGYEVTAIGHPRLALEAATIKPFRVAIVDYKLSEMDGLELIRRLHLLLPDFRPILLTGCADPLLSQQAQIHGTYACLTKPCRLDQVRSLVAEALQLETAAT